MRSRFGWLWATGAALSAAGAAAIGVSALGRLALSPGPKAELAAYATSLQGRTPNQRYNAWRAARELDGARIPPGGVFSFNRRVNSWGQDQGYVKAPVSYDGELVRAYGGGVCQTSTTLYNAALLAGLPIMERHSHVFSAHYAAPGRDAAVAHPNIDLRFRNPYAWPLVVRAGVEGSALSVRILGVAKPETSVSIRTEVLNSISPERLTRVASRPRLSAGRVFVRNPGMVGGRVVTWRTFYRRGREIRRERLSDDTYEAMNRIVQLNEE